MRNGIKKWICIFALHFRRFSTKAWTCCADFFREATCRRVIIAFTKPMRSTATKPWPRKLTTWAARRLGRLYEEEQRYRNIGACLDKILNPPGTRYPPFGFHILGIFSPKTNLRDLEFLLLQLGLPA